MNFCRYHASQSEKDKEISKKISDALEKLKDAKEEKQCSTDTAFSEDSSSESECDTDLDPDKEMKNESDAEIGSLDDSMDDEGVGAEDDSSTENETTDVNWKTNLAQKAADAFLERQKSTASLWKLVYGMGFIFI